ncbi:MAG: CapA family protein [Bacteroidota bacterium]
MVENKKISVSFVGDISFNDAYIEYYQNGINPFVNIQPLLRSKDYVIGNLECMAKGEEGENLLRKPRLTTTVETLNYLNMLNVNVVSLAQNHVYDHLKDGFVKTTSFLKDNNISYLGASLTKTDVEKPLIISKEGINIGLLNYVTQDTNPNLPIAAEVYLNFFTIEKVIHEVKELKKKVDHVVLLLHWGGRVEGGAFPDFDQPELAKKLVDAGADLIIGHHSHTLQPFEIYKNKYIFYSLGNFCFSDYVFDGKTNPIPDSQNISTIVSVFFQKTTYKIDFNFFINQKTSFSELNYLSKLKRRNSYLKILFKYNYLWRSYFFYKRRMLPFVIFMKRKDLKISEKINRLFYSFKKRLN